MYVLLRRSWVVLLFVCSFAISADLTCPKGLSASRQLALGRQRLPELTAENRQSLVEEFAADGRPILVITDASWKQKSGVVTVMTVLQENVARLTGDRSKIVYLTPDDLPSLSFKYQDLAVAWLNPGSFSKLLRDINPQAIHIMVEGPLGKQAARFLRAKGIPYSTAYHTEFPEYVRGEMEKRWWARYFAGAIRDLVNRDLRSFHAKGEGVMVPTESMAAKLVDENGYPGDILRYWSHGVDTELFQPRFADPKVFAGLPRPISLYVGRIAVEKNLEDFLRMNIPGTKVLAGGGPSLEELKKKYPQAVFLGRKDYKKELPAIFASSDIFVFTSLTDTFGLVQLEALASGVPVLAYDVQGPVDVITSRNVGRLVPYLPGGNLPALEAGWHEAIALGRRDCREFALQHTWERSTLEFMHFLTRIPRGMYPMARLVNP